MGGPSSSTPTAIGGDAHRGNEKATEQEKSTARKMQKRRPIACKHCNGRRIRCDASVIGLPCSNCTAARIQDCNFIVSKRKRHVAPCETSYDTPTDAAKEEQLVDLLSPQTPETMLDTVRYRRQCSISPAAMINPLRAQAMT